MKRFFLVLGFLLLDGTLFWGLRRLESQKAELTRKQEELSLSAEAARQSGERSRAAAALLERSAREMGRVDRSLDIAELRHLLLSAESGLDLDRFSLDFRPTPDAPKGTEGGRISANLGGSFDAVHAYLTRVEELRLPLAPETVSLRMDDSGRILLAVEWNGLWRGDAAPEVLSVSEIARLENWLGREPAPRPGRDLFSTHTAAREPFPPAALEAERATPEEAESLELEPASISSPPRLTGFVIARPELETDVNRRVLAALRFEGELRLLAVGDAIGNYRVEEIDARESVLLVDQESGERLTLFLE